MVITDYRVSENRKRRKKFACNCLLRLGLPPATLQAESDLSIRNVLTRHSWSQQQGNCVLSAAKVIEAYPTGTTPYHFI